MPRHVGRYMLCLITALGAPLSAAGASQQPAYDNVEAGLVKAMELDKATGERPNEPGEPIRAYKARGLISFKPDTRRDYTDYYQLKARTPFLGQTLLVIEEEYMTQYLGCCIDPGFGVFVAITGPTDEISRRAGENKCDWQTGSAVVSQLRELEIGLEVDGEAYGHLSCRSRSIALDKP